MGLCSTLKHTSQGRHTKTIYTSTFFRLTIHAVTATMASPQDQVTPAPSPATTEPAGTDSDDEYYVQGSLFTARNSHDGVQPSSSYTEQLEVSTGSTSGYLKRKAYEEIPHLKSKMCKFFDDYVLLNSDKEKDFNKKVLPSRDYVIKNNKNDEASVSLCAEMSGTRNIKNKTNGPRFRLFSGKEEEVRIVTNPSLWDGFPEKRGYFCSASCWAIQSIPRTREQMMHFMRNIYEALRPTRVSLKTVNWKGDDKTICEVEWYSDADKCPRWLEILRNQDSVSILLPKYEKEPTGWVPYENSPNLYRYEMGYSELVRCTFRIQPPTQTVVYTYKWPAPPSDAYYNIDQLEAKVVKKSKFESLW